MEKYILKQNKTDKIFLFIIISVGVFFRLFHLSVRSFWCDEFLAIFLGSKPFPWMINYITFHDAHPPLFYFIVGLFLKYGKSEFFLRLLPVFFGVLCIPFSYILGKEIFGRKEGILLASILSLNPAHILWSQILKSYTLFTFLLIISFYFFYKLIFYEQKKKLWIGLFFINVCILYLHNLGFITLLIQFFFLLLRKKLNKKWFFYYMFIFFSYLPWLSRIPCQLSFTLGIRRPIPLFYKFIYHFFYFFLGETINPFYFVIVIPAFLVFSFFLLSGLSNLFNIKNEKNFLVLLGIFVPLFFIPFPSTIPQNLIPYSIFWYILLTLGIKKMKNVFFIFFIIPFFLFSVFFYYTENVFHYHDISKLVPYREIGKFLSDITGKNDIILITEKREFIFGKDFSAFDWYYKGEAKVIDITEEKIDFNNISKLLENYKYFWLFLNLNQYYELSCKLKVYFDKNYKKIWEEKYLWNERILQRLKKNKGKDRYYNFIEIYLYKR